MSWQEMILELLNSNACVTLIAGVFTIILGKIFRSKPEWQEYYDKYKGAAIHAVKVAEKAIDNDTDNKYLHRLDMALNYVLSVVEAQEGRKATEADKAKAKVLISNVHDEFENPEL